MKRDIQKADTGGWNEHGYSKIKFGELKQNKDCKLGREKNSQINWTRPRNDFLPRETRRISSPPTEMKELKRGDSG